MASNNNRYHIKSMAYAFRNTKLCNIWQWCLSSSVLAQNMGLHCNGNILSNLHGCAEVVLDILLSFIAPEEVRFSLYPLDLSMNCKINVNVTMLLIILNLFHLKISKGNKLGTIGCGAGPNMR